MRVEIEDYNGNTIGSFRIKNVEIKDVKEIEGFSIADIDKDYIGNTKDELIRLQSID